MLRRAVLPAALLVLAACKSGAPPLTDADKAAVTDSLKALSRRFYAALDSRDVGRIMSFYVAGDYISAEYGKMYRNRAAIDSSSRAFWGSLKTARFTNESEKITVLDRDNAVLATGWRGVMTDTAGNAMDMKGMWVGTFHRTDAGWKVVAESNTTPAPAAPPPAPGRRS